MKKIQAKTELLKYRCIILFTGYPGIYNWRRWKQQVSSGLYLYCKGKR